jgi:archaeal arginyl aminopeptidase
MKALIISADNFEDSELLVPFYRLQEAGVEVEVASPVPGTITGKHGYQVAVDKVLAEVDPADYALLVLPGGKAPAAVRKEPQALAIARSFFARNKPVAAICHGPQTLISAGLLQGRRATCYRSVAEELKAAGAIYEDREVVVDGNLVTSRQPADLPAFMREVMGLLGRPCRLSEKEEACS